jgi:hypothetical protein
MTFNKILLWSIFILPWFSLFLLKRHSIKRYMPVAIFTTLLVTLYYEIAFTQKWFIAKETIFPWFIVFVPFIFGLFMVGTIWIFNFTFGRFWLYIITNLIIDCIYTFLLRNWFINLGLIQNIRANNFNVFIAFTLIAIIIYEYQVWQDKVLE